jgi:hypothetical protein
VEFNTGWQIVYGLLCAQQGNLYDTNAIGGWDYISVVLNNKIVTT